MPGPCTAALRAVASPATYRTGTFRLIGRAALGVRPAALLHRLVAPLLLLAAAAQTPAAAETPAQPGSQVCRPPTWPPPLACLPASRSHAAAPLQQQQQQRRLGRLLAHVSGERGASTATMASAAGAVEVVRVPCLQDNYAWLVHEPSQQLTAVVDTPETGPIVKALEAKGWKLTHVLNTHHHWDHTGGNEELKERYGCTIVGPDADRDRIPGIDVAVKDGESFQFGAAEVRVFDTPGHTRGHITYWLPQGQALFPGDTLFALGCGRLFEGSPQQMWASLSKLLALPPETKVYCAHEYTQSNARFAVHADPENEALRKRKAEIDDLRSKGQPTVPSLLGEEFETNPFLRPDDPGVRKALGIPAAAPTHEAFGAIRAAKDHFK